MSSSNAKTRTLAVQLSVPDDGCGLPHVICPISEKAGCADNRSAIGACVYCKHIREIWFDQLTIECAA